MKRWVPSLVRLLALTGTFAFLFVSITPRLAKVPTEAVTSVEEYIVQEPLDEKRVEEVPRPTPRPAPRPTPTPPAQSPQQFPRLPDEVLAGFLAGLAVEIAIQASKGLFALAVKRRKK